jgi:uncharacterized membrane protein
MLWSGTPDSAVDLHRDPYYLQSEAYGISDDQQVGHALWWGDNYYHAVLWRGTAASLVDLHPDGYTQTHAWAVANGMQVGSGTRPDTRGYDHALLWSGSAVSVVDLHQFLPPGFNGSIASGIDIDGTIVGTAITTPIGPRHAVIWVPQGP